MVFPNAKIYVLNSKFSCKAATVWHEVLQLWKSLQEVHPCRGSTFHLCNRKTQLRNFDRDFKKKGGGGAGRRRALNN